MNSIGVAEVEEMSEPDFTHRADFLVFSSVSGGIVVIIIIFFK